MSASIKLGQDIVWGTTGAGTSSLGKILSLDRKSTAKTHEQEDENGELYSLVVYDQREEVTVEILAKPAVTLPAIGAAVTIAGITDMLVMDASEKWATSQGKKISLTLMKSTA